MIGEVGREARASDLVVIGNERRALVGDHELALTAREFDVLASLAERPGWVLTPEQLCDDDPESYSSPYAVNVHISHLRAKLAEAGAPGLIETVRGVGWRLRRTGSGPGESGMSERSVGEAVAAARVAALGYDYQEAVLLLSDALSRLDASSADRGTHSRLRSVLLERRGSARMAQDDAVGASGDFEAALALRPLEDHLARARLCTRLGFAANAQRDRGAGETALARALGELEAEADRNRAWWQAWIEVHLQRARATCLTDLPLWDPEVRPQLERAVEEHASVAQKAKYHLVLADTAFYAQRWAVSDDGLSHAREGLDFALRSDSTYLQSLATGELGSMLVFAGQYAEAEIRLRQAIDLSERCGDRMGVLAATMFLSLAARLSGDIRGAERHALELRRLVGEHPGAPEFGCTALGQLAWVALRRGERDAAAQLSEQAVAQWECDPSMSQSVWVMAWPAAACALADGDSARAFEYATLMTRPDQQALADGMETRIAEAVASYRAGDIDQAVGALGVLQAEAHHLGYA